MKTVKEKANGIVLCLFELIVGVLLLINPVGFTAGIIKVTGIVLMILGLIEIVKYFKMSAEEASLGQSLVKGLVSVLAGGFCTFRTGWFLITFPVLTILYGVIILLAGLGKVQLTVDLLRRKNKNWVWAAINAAISIVCASVILNNPFTSATVLWVFTGASLIVEGVFDMITFFVRGNSQEESDR
ncbi:MAG: DUF308 domain-containing protein [Lachnospiraceae bacterium]|nr:DUF308 domain-containing protein [Lachnospiraceae bacterium]